MEFVALCVFYSEVVFELAVYFLFAQALIKPHPVHLMHNILAFFDIVYGFYIISAFLVVVLFFCCNIFWFFIKKLLICQHYEFQLFYSRTAKSKVVCQKDLVLHGEIIWHSKFKIAKNILDSVFVICCNDDFIAFLHPVFNKGKDFLHFWRKTRDKRAFKLYSVVTDCIKKIVKRYFLKSGNCCLKIRKIKVCLIFQRQRKSFLGIFFNLFFVIFINLCKFWKNFRRLIQHQCRGILAIQQKLR